MFQGRVSDDDRPRGKIHALTEDVVSQTSGLSPEPRHEWRFVWIDDFDAEEAVHRIDQTLVGCISVGFFGVSVGSDNFCVGGGCRMLRGKDI